MQLYLIPIAPRAQEPQTTTEKWLPIPGFEGYYEVSDHGRVRSYRYRKQWHVEPLCNKPFIHRPGYVYFRLFQGRSGRNYAAHRLVMLAFVGPSSLDVNHKDGDKHNNHLSNLEYVTTKENIRHAIEVLGVRLGNNSGPAPETDQDREIRRLAARGVSQYEIARRYGISQPAVSYIVRGLTRPPAK